MSNDTFFNIAKNIRHVIVEKNTKYHFAVRAKAQGGH
jgi:hypothetical protein